MKAGSAQYLSALKLKVESFNHLICILPVWNPTPRQWDVSCWWNSFPPWEFDIHTVHQFFAGSVKGCIISISSSTHIAWNSLLTFTQCSTVLNSFLQEKCAQCEMMDAHCSAMCLNLEFWNHCSVCIISPRKLKSPVLQWMPSFRDENLKCLHPSSLKPS